MFAYLGAIANGSYPLIFAAAILMSGVVYSAMNGIQPALYGEMFPTRVRLSGMAIGTQIGYAIGGFVPTAAAAFDGDGTNWLPVAAYEAEPAAPVTATRREAVGAGIPWPRDPAPPRRAHSEVPEHVYGPVARWGRAEWRGGGT